ncbi:MAG TPA: CHC2 zinc finger domain-containing protein [Gammaproteobacteria bacterium]|nr:CHC2 zinc finger domain-containing protein [Gammaproteobacteria bacterium]
MSARYKLSADYQRAYAKPYGRTEKKSRYRRDLLPDPADYYEKHLDKLHRRGDWADTRCPLHEDTSPSLSVSLTHGGFICRGCRASGRDVLAFHRRLRNLDFVAAAKDLGAWEDSHD